MRHRLTLKAIPALTVLALVFTAACGARAAVEIQPTAEGVNSARDLAVRAADATRVSATIVNEFGDLLDDLPLPEATKNGYDCAILKIAGTRTPATPTVQSTCGSVPLSAEAPIAKTLDTLRSVSECASLSATVKTLVELLNPLLASLESSTNAAVRMAGVSLRASAAFLISINSGGVTCSA